MSGDATPPTVGNACPTCEGSGTVTEYHGQGDQEHLGCPDCLATGTVCPMYAGEIREMVLALRAALAARDAWRAAAQRLHDPAACDECTPRRPPVERPVCWIVAMGET